MAPENPANTNELNGLITKTNLKQEVYQNTIRTFAVLKEVLKELAEQYSKKLKDKVPDAVLPFFQEK